MAATTNMQLYSSDISSIAAATTDGTDSSDVDVSDVDVAAIQVKATGANASASGNIVTSLVVSVDGTNYDTQTYATHTLVLSGTTAVRATQLIDVRGCSRIKVTSIENTDATYAANTINVFLGKTLI